MRLLVKVIAATFLNRYEKRYMVGLQRSFVFDMLSER